MIGDYATISVSSGARIIANAAADMTGQIPPHL